jgi:hypothetical protein
LLPKTIGSPTNGVVLPLHFPPQKQTFLSLKIACEAREKRKEDVNSEAFSCLNGLGYSHDKGLCDLIVDNFLVCSAGNEELVLNVDVMFRLRNKLEICNVDAEFSEFSCASD